MDLLCSCWTISLPEGREPQHATCTMRQVSSCTTALACSLGASSLNAGLRHRLGGSFKGSVCVQLLDFWPAWRLWRSLHFAPHLMMIAIILVGQVSCCACPCRVPTVLMIS